MAPLQKQFLNRSHPFAVLCFKLSDALTRSCIGFPLTFTHSFGLFLQRLFKPTTTQRRSRHSADTVSEFYTEAPQAIANEGFAQGPYLAAREGVELMTLRTIGFNSTAIKPH